VVRIFPSREACLRLVTALAVEQSEEWVTGRHYLDMSKLEEQRHTQREVGEVRLMERRRRMRLLGGNHNNLRH
jgi:hypothetical protein